MEVVEVSISKSTGEGKEKGSCNGKVKYGTPLPSTTRVCHFLPSIHPSFHPSIRPSLHPCIRPFPPFLLSSFPPFFSFLFFSFFFFSFLFLTVTYARAQHTHSQEKHALCCCAASVSRLAHCVRSALLPLSFAHSSRSVVLLLTSHRRSVRALHTNGFPSSFPVGASRHLGCSRTTAGYHCSSSFLPIHLFG